MVMFNSGSVAWFLPRVLGADVDAAAVMLGMKPYQVLVQFPNLLCHGE